LATPAATVPTPTSATSFTWIRAGRFAFFRSLHGQQELLANVSHELCSPLARIRVVLALLPHDGDGEARLGDVETDLAELDRLIEDVLTTARLDATGLPPPPGPIDVAGLLAELAARDPLTTGKAVSVAPGRCRTSRPTAPSSSEPSGTWSRMPPSTARPRSGSRPRRAARTRDSPSPTRAKEGIAPAERVLAPFYRLDRARTPHPAGAPSHGFDLGLTLAGRIAEVHGGRITIEAATVQDGHEQGAGSC
jgi:signal transduction histidine kinase